MQRLLLLYKVFSSFIFKKNPLICFSDIIVVLFLFCLKFPVTRLKRKQYTFDVFFEIIRFSHFTVLV